MALKAVFFLAALGLAIISSVPTAHAVTVYSDSDQLRLVCRKDVLVFGKDSPASCLRNLADDDTDAPSGVSFGEVFGDFWEQLTSTFDPWVFNADMTAAGSPGCGKKTEKLTVKAGSRYRIKKVLGLDDDTRLDCIGDSKANAVILVLEDESNGQEMDMTIAAPTEPFTRQLRYQTVKKLRSEFGYAFWIESRQ